jgi:hypothetical protein
MARTEATSNGLPRVWAIMIARVRGVIASSMAATLIL